MQWALCGSRESLSSEGSGYREPLSSEGSGYREPLSSEGSGPCGAALTWLSKTTSVG